MRAGARPSKTKWPMNWKIQALTHMADAKGSDDGVGPKAVCHGSHAGGWATKYADVKYSMSITGR